MKTKAIIFSLLVLLGVGMTTTSCEDMFTPENSLVETDLTPADTLYQMMGIVRGMQKVIDKSIILGEVRADLVDINAYTTTDLQELSKNNVGDENAYNTPSDFYGVVNLCNVYLAKVDSLQETKGVKKYREEVIAAKTFRAWAYLELAKIYGTVPFYTDPITTAQEGEDVIDDTANRKGLVEVGDFLIGDLFDYASIDENNALRPSYSSTYTNANLPYSKFFIPVRLMLAELYLYRGSFTHNESDFVNAVRFYHDFLAFTGEELTTGSYRSYWIGNSFTSFSSSYSNKFSVSAARDAEWIAFVPMDTIKYYGNYTDIRSVFNAQYSNNYYANVNPSARYMEMSQAQSNCVYVYNSATDVDTVYAPTTKDGFSDFENPERYVGDLRYNSNLYTFNLADMYHAEYSVNRQYIAKYTGGSSRLNNDERIAYLPLFRKSMVYLHFAEALNRAGFPETAFAILKYGISDTVLEDRTKISLDEYTRLKEITSYGFASNAADWDEDIFITRDVWAGGMSSGGSASNAINVNQWPIHCFGSGDAWCNKYYYIPTDSSGILPYPEYAPAEDLDVDGLAAYDEQYKADCADIDTLNMEYIASEPIRSQRMKEVDKLILMEEALEGAYEGYRFYDLMRYSMYNYGTLSYLVEAINQRKGAENPGSYISEGKVYLSLPKR